MIVFTTALNVFTINYNCKLLYSVFSNIKRKVNDVKPFLQTFLNFYMLYAKY